VQPVCGPHRPALGCRVATRGDRDGYCVVRLRNGAVYRYFTVPRSILEGFLTAPSKGAYFTHRIKSAFPHAQIVGPPRQS
jgi:hypothetical protein